MYRIIVMLLLATSFSWLGCDSSDSRYVDLNSGESIEVRDSAGIMVNTVTGEPVELYVDTKNNDTIYGRTGKVVNGSIRRDDGNRWIYINVDENAGGTGNAGAGVKVQNEDGEIKIKSGDYKKEVEKDGDITIKDGNTKIKIDGETGERKVKKDD